MSATLLAQLEALIRHDPAQRGLIGSEAMFGPASPGHLAGAATSLAEHATHVSIVTGFFIPRGAPPACETDGPPGALLLADVLSRSGVEVHVITDAHCANGVRAAARAQAFPEDRLIVAPRDAANDWVRAYFAGRGAGLTHLVAIERVGPSHTPSTLVAQPRAEAAPLERFLSLVPPEHHDRRHNMRGEIINEFTGELDRLFLEIGTAIPEARTIGIGDGGNEIGMGCVPWEDLERRLTGPQAGWIPCRVACDWNIIAGTSNWGAYALAAGFAALRGRTDLLRPLTVDQQRHVLQKMVDDGPAVDGVTRRREPTVDGLPFMTYIQCWEGMRRLLGIS
jgi:D-glutamate cyclase